MTEELPRPGELFQDKYRIEEEIGAGGFAAVFRATDTATERAVAIKILVPLDHETNYSERLIARFEREARLLAGLKSQHTVTMYEFGRSDDGFLYLVFEFVDGRTLSRIIGAHGRQPPERVVHILRQVCTALVEAHRRGVLHRDIKPANIMVYDHLDVRDVVKLIDFGIAKPIGSDDGEPVEEDTITSDGALLGTPRYMSPEQIAHQNLTPASDIYSLGLVAYELLTGQHGVPEESATGVIRNQLSDREIEFPGDHRVPAGLRRVVERMIRKERARRYQDVADIIRDLKTWDETEVRSPLIFASAAGLLFGGLLLVAALLAPDSNAAKPTAEPTTRTMGDPMFAVPMTSPDLSYIWMSSSQKWDLQGGTDPRKIPQLARFVVAVERAGVQMEPGTRYVTDLSDWDGKTNKEMVVRQVGELEYKGMIRAQMAAVRAGRSVSRRGRARSVERVLNRATGHRKTAEPTSDAGR